MMRDRVLAQYWLLKEKFLGSESAPWCHYGYRDDGHTYTRENLEHRLILIMMLALGSQSLKKKTQARTKDVAWPWAHVNAH